MMVTPDWAMISHQRPLRGASGGGFVEHLCSSEAESTASCRLQTEAPYRACHEVEFPGQLIHTLAQRTGVTLD